jgi:hypothetical protein
MYVLCINNKGNIYTYLYVVYKLFFPLHTHTHTQEQQKRAAENSVKDFIPLLEVTKVQRIYAIYGVYSVYTTTVPLLEVTKVQ